MINGDEIGTTLTMSTGYHWMELMYRAGMDGVVTEQQFTIRLHLTLSDSVMAADDVSRSNREILPSLPPARRYLSWFPSADRHVTLPI
jgi:hypothetical protein